MGELARWAGQGGGQEAVPNEEEGIHSLGDPRLPLPLSSPSLFILPHPRQVNEDEL